MRKIYILILFSASIISGTTVNSQSLISKFGIQPIDPIPCTAVKDQAWSATCWSFASVSFLESEVLRTKNKNIDLSEMYLARFSYLNKIKKHLEVAGKNKFTPGGQFHDVTLVLSSAGIVPDPNRNSTPALYKPHDHGELDTAMSKLIKNLLAEKKTKPTAEDWKYINTLLDKNLGKVPTSINADGKEYTPQQYLNTYLGINEDNFIELTSYTHHPYYKKFVLENEYNWLGAGYMNVPLANLTSITDNALEKGYTVLWSGDVNEPGFDFDHGAAYMNYEPADKVEERQLSFADSSSYLDHVMHIVGKTTDKTSRKWYLVKNSWGTNSDNPTGYLYMSEDYFLIKTAAIVVNKEAIDKEIRKKMME